MAFRDAKKRKNQEKNLSKMPILCKLYVFAVKIYRKFYVFYIGYLLQYGAKYGIITRLDVR